MSAGQPNRPTFVSQLAAETQKQKVQLASEEDEGGEDEEEEEEEGAEGDDRSEKEIDSGESDKSNRATIREQVDTRHLGKLAGETKNKTASKRSSAEQPSGQQAGGGEQRRPDGGQQGQRLTRPASLLASARQDNNTSTSTSCAKPAGAKKLGLLEALLGERGRNWFEHRTVILDIQNGKQRPQTADKSNQSTAKQSGQTIKRAESYTKLNEQDELGQDNNHKKDGANLVASGKVSTEQQETRLRKYSRLPTFGSVPQKLNSLSLAAASSRRDIEITPKSRPRQQVAAREKQQAAAGSKLSFRYTNGRNSVGSSRLSNLSSSSASSSQLTSSTGSSSLAPTPQQQAHANSRGRSSLFGFSNISNLFPGEPVRRHQRQQGQRVASNHKSRSASLTNLEAKKRAAGDSCQRQRQLDRLLSAGGSPSGAALAAAEAARQRTRRLAQQHPAQPSRPASAMVMRQRAMPPTSGQRDSKRGASYASYGQQRLRPASATGNYLSAGGARGRSPSGSYRLGSAGMSPLVDHDCPVHGEQAAAFTGRRGRSHERAGELFAERARAAPDYEPTASRRQLPPGFYSSSQPDLMYDDADPYNIARPARDYAPSYGPAGRTPPYAAKGSPIYSPIGDYESGRAGSLRAVGAAERRHQMSSQQGAYYNDSSRFSLYHAAPDGSGVRSSLAPTSEQLRRILGYRPQPLAKPVHLHPQWAYTRPFIHLQPAGSGFGRSPSPALMIGEDGEPLDSDRALKFAPFNRLQDSQAIRAVDFHPSGEVYAIGSNSRALRICAYPAEHELRHFAPFERDHDHNHDDAGPQDEAGAAERTVKTPRVLFKFLQLHRGSIYCVSFNPSGQLLATGSNDQTIHIAKYNSITHNPDGEEFRLTMHSGTVRDLCFIDDSSGNGSSLLLSAGGGDNKIYVTDCDTITPFQSMAGHTQMVMALNHCGGAQFVSGSYDKTIRFWDLRARSCTSIVSAPPTNAFSGTGAGSGALTSGPGAPVCALRVDPSGRLLASGHTDTTCMLYDIRGGKIIQTFRPHDDEIRAISFSPKSYYLLTGGYDGRLVVSDLQGDLTQPLPSVCVAESQDKIVQAKWHPADLTFVSTSADKSATLWSLPSEIRN